MIGYTFAVKTFFIVLTIVQIGTIVYCYLMDNCHSCFDTQERWLQVGLIDYSIYSSFIAAWFFYKESRWILRVVFIFLLSWLGSFTVCGYVIIQFCNLSQEESLKDPLYYVLASRQKGGDKGDRRQPSILTTRVIFIALGCLMPGILVFMFLIDGCPFREKIFMPCMITMASDLFIQAAVFSVWVAYKESSWINVLIWIICSLCFGSIAMCVYVVWELFYLSPEQPVSLILFNKSNRDMILSEYLLSEHSNV